MSDNQPQPPSSAHAPREDDFVERRRVVKGLASVPVILTLGNGAAQANASTHQCLTNAATLPVPECVPVSDDPSGNTLDKAWAWQKVTTDGTENWCVVYGVEDPPGTLLITDADGTPIGPDDGGNPLLASCMASFV